jgi:hypothetical protein
MKTLTFNRSEILSFFDLEDYQRKQVLSNYYDSEDSASEDSFVIFGVDHEPLPLSMFMRCDSGLWDGVYSTSYFSAYFIKLNRSCDQALIAERYC